MLIRLPDFSVCNQLAYLRHVITDQTTDDEEVCGKMIQMHKQTSSYATLHVETNDNNDAVRLLLKREWTQHI